MRIVLRLTVIIACLPVIALSYLSGYLKFKKALRRGMAESGLPPAVARELAKSYKVKLVLFR
jgi:hypothetical protein